MATNRRVPSRRLSVCAVACGSIISMAAAAADINTTAPEYLKQQGWTDRAREWMYGFTQGSQIIPYDWFLALERADGNALFRTDLQRFGYLPRQRSKANPDGLPVGFAIDTDRAGNWIGLNCTACHTGRVEVNGRVIQIDGAPGYGDLYAFIRDLSAAMQATLADAAKFSRFFERVRKTNPKLAAQSLQAQLTASSGSFAQFSEDSKAGADWGPARADAFGMIFNRVARIDLDIAANNRPPDAPVSYPFLWTTNRQDWAQWNGSVPNKRISERLGRNVGQVLGVFGKMPGLASPAAFERHEFASSVHGARLLQASLLVGRLQPPPWPGPAVDQMRADRGKATYQERCVGCHVDARGNTGVLKVRLVKLDEIGTDRRMATNIADRDGVATGVLAGRRVSPLDDERFGPTAKAAAILKAVVANSILDLSMWRPVPGQFAPLTTIAALVDTAKIGDDIRLVKSEAASLDYYTGDAERREPSYKAGPLNGIWATAPYLHNGSVPNLHELLLPAKDRRTSFTVGSRRLDTARVGFASDPGDGAFVFDTTRPGNAKEGHSGAAYGTELRPEERLDLIEYLKTL